MLGRTYERENCSAARALEFVGERWSLLILRDAIFRGRIRFSEFQSSLGIATNVLTARLERFVANGLMERRGRDGQEYQLTERGLDFTDTLVALTAWGDKWSAPNGPPIDYRHDDCDGPVTVELRCTACGRVVQPGNVLAEPGPGSSAAV